MTGMTHLHCRRNGEDIYTVIEQIEQKLQLQI